MTTPVRTVRLVDHGVALRHPEQTPADAPLFAFDFAEAPTRAAAQLWYVPFHCTCIGVVAFGRASIRTYCATHAPPPPNPLAPLPCGGCGGVGTMITDPTGTRCRACGWVRSRARLD